MAERALPQPVGIAPRTGRGCAFALLLALSLASPTRAATFRVDSTGDGPDADTSDGSCDDGSGGCTLRAAIDQANAGAGHDVIEFAIPPFDGSVKTIAPGSALPNLTDRDGVTIDGYTQDDARPNSLAAGDDAVLRIELDGVEASSANGLTIAAGTAAVRGLVIDRFEAYGIASFSDGVTVEGNFIGAGASGSDERGNGSGILVSGGASHIGGDTPAARNVISGNSLVGIAILGDGATNNTVQGNYIGTTASGTAALPNASGVDLEAPNNTLGGAAASPGLAPGNVISGNSSGVRILGRASGTTVQGNLIGPDVTGTVDISGENEGIMIEAPDNTIGGAEADERNVIAGYGNGIYVSSPAATGNVVQGNYIGTNRDGTAALPNSGAGVIASADETVIGGAAAAPGAPPGNVISANYLGGIAIFEADHCVVRGNLLGTEIDGSSPIGNVSHGISLGPDSDGDTIGGMAPGEGNRIAFSTGNGVQAAFEASSRGHLIAGNSIFSNDRDGVLVQSGGGIALRANSIFSNAGLGIDLVGGVENAFAVTANDAGDADTGSNGLQNFPELIAVRAGNAATSIAGVLHSTPETAFTVELFASESCDPSGYGEGASPIGTTMVTTGADGTGAIEAQFPVALTPGNVVTATATDPSGNTSEFSFCVAVTAVETPTQTPADATPGTPTETPTPLASATITTTPPSATPTAGTPTRTATGKRTDSPTPVPGACHGDCDENGRVSIDELVRGLRIALGGAPAEDCGAFDADGNGRVSLDEVVRAVADALRRCRSQP